MNIREKILNWLADYFKSNPNFDYTEFLNACLHFSKKNAEVSAYFDSQDVDQLEALYNEAVKLVVFFCN